jgi:hypothetical protein
MSCHLTRTCAAAESKDSNPDEGVSCSSLVFVVQVAASATSRSLIQWSPARCVRASNCV